MPPKRCHLRSIGYRPILSERGDAEPTGGRSCYSIGAKGQSTPFSDPDDPDGSVGNTPVYRHTVEVDLVVCLNHGPAGNLVVLERESNQ